MHPTEKPARTTEACRPEDSQNPSRAGGPAGAVPASEIQTVLLSAVEVVLETACCAGVFKSLEEAPPDPRGEVVITVRVPFEGKPSGEFSLHVPEGLTLLLAARFLGRDEWEVSAGQAEEVALELANMICGAVLSNLCAGATFQMMHPLTKGDGGTDCGGAVCRWFDVGEGSLTACLQFRKAI
ncbi:MAG: chemotaxis protein CheX [Bryobacterales bacterium]|nr:chemotaxis protein CheX [Bryobacterales bacterium]